MTEARSPEHRVLDYLRDCVEADHAASQYRVIGSKDLLLVESGATPLNGDPALLSSARGAVTWARARESAGSNETLWAGWPVARGRKQDRGKSTEVAAALLFTEVMVQRVGNGGYQIAPTSRSVELDDAALGLLGVPTDERERLMREYATAIGQGTVAPLDQAITFLRDAGVLPDEFDPGALGPFDRGAPISNCAIAWAGDADRSAFTRVLVQDLDELRKHSVKDLQVGPLGVLLGSIENGAAALPLPTPAVLATTLEQERAICSGLSATVTVVTGPPGTGKSQVLANTVAAALANGERVLLASKNNHAIDVVHERLAGMHEDGVPIRAGKASFRGEAAQQMGAALARQRPDSTGLAQARHQWDAVRSLVGKPYEQIAERVELEGKIEQARVKVAGTRSALPPEVAIDPLLVDADLLGVSIAAARRRVTEYEAAPGRWFWQKKRKRAAEKEADEAVQTVASLAGESGHDACRQMLASEGSLASLDLATVMLELLVELDRLHEFERSLALLPDTSAADQAISDSFASRQDPATELFGALWREHLRPQSPSRGNARQYQSSLAARAGGGSMGPIRSQVTGALEVFPVWSLTSLTAGTWFPLTSGLFDLVIIDEASQSDIASALPLLFRAKRAMIVGDPSQLTHITALSASMDVALAEANGLDEQALGRYSHPNTSLFGLAASRSKTEPIFLNRHFRSHPDVIGFSNDMFYGSRLRVETDQSRFLPDPAFRWVDVKGDFQTGPGGRSGKNIPEAEEVLRQLGLVLDELRGQNRTIGVVTPLSPQKQLLVKMVGERHPDDKITVDTAHGFQGDERDVMIVSLVVAAGAPPGLVGFVADANLLNVALTRSRARTIVVGDKEFASSSGTRLAGLAAYGDGIASKVLASPS